MRAQRVAARPRLRRRALSAHDRAHQASLLEEVSDAIVEQTLKPLIRLFGASLGNRLEPRFAIRLHASPQAVNPRGSSELTDNTGGPKSLMIQTPWRFYSERRIDKQQLHRHRPY